MTAHKRAVGKALSGTLVVLVILAGALFAAASTALTSDDRAPAATLFGRPIYLDAFQPPTQWKTHEGKTDAEYAAWLRDWQLEQANGKIWSALMEHFCKDRDCEPTVAECEAFEAAMRKQQERDPLLKNQPREPAISPEEYQRIRTELQQQVQSPGLTDDQRKELTLAAATLDGLKDKKLGEPTREISTLWVRAWKMNRALYRQYGGEVIWQQAGLEPLEAYRTWFEENERSGAFTMLDPQLRERFWRYFKIGHIKVDEKFLKETGLKDPFEKPWWLLEPSAGDQDQRIGREPGLPTPH